MRSQLTRLVLRTCLVYSLVAAIWILLSDRMLRVVVADPDTIVQLQTYKGWMFVAVTTLLLYGILRRELRRWEQEASERQRAEDEIRQLNAELELRVAARTAELTEANAGLQAQIAERMELERQLQEHAKRTSALAELSQSLAGIGRDLQPLCNTIVTHIASQLGDACVLTLCSADGRRLEIVAISHSNPARAGFLRELLASVEYSVDDGLAGRVARTGEVLLLPSLEAEHMRGEIHSAYHEYVNRFGVASLLIVPLLAHGQILGTLGVSRDQPGRPYTTADQSFLRDLASRAGLAIENARLFVVAEEARAEAERASHAKSAFLASVSHELRTPMNAIIGFTGTLLMKLPGPLTDHQEKQLTTVQRSAQHLLALINNILDLAKIEAGKLEVSIAPVVCQEVIDEVATSLSPLAERKALQLRVECPAEPVVIPSDRRMLNHILVNLVNNAIKFTDRGFVAIELERVAAVDGWRTEIRVADSGLGISAADQARLFQAFERVGAADARQREGTGLGLRLSQQLAQLLGAQIAVRSQYGSGSVFTLLLPDVRAEPRPAGYSGAP
ncbi:MAG TPA: ATP-binding protein [Kouleothrix sp.]|uniref:GAF domain-containing sensor histidine kinase n=1 Tax=Kouleothrix sp. TaxID=2779161 RepID=UPI002C5E8F9C|nr:ATP-binding protein [Kouleothrix sp.]HRC76051.1 ATP-binding protein [Kouleothrix sp.]